MKIGKLYLNFSILLVLEFGSLDKELRVIKIKIMNWSHLKRIDLGLKNKIFSLSSNWLNSFFFSWKTSSNRNLNCICTFFFISDWALWQGVSTLRNVSYEYFSYVIRLYAWILQAKWDIYKLNEYHKSLSWNYSKQCSTKNMDIFFLILRSIDG